MNDDFALILDKFTDEIIEKNLLERFQAYLLGTGCNLSDTKSDEERKEEILKVCDKFDLIKFLQKYFICFKFWNFANFCSTSQHEKQRKI